MNQAIYFPPKFKNVKFVRRIGTEKMDTHPIELHLYTLWSDYTKQFNDEGGEVIVTMLRPGQNDYQLNVENKNLIDISL